MAGFEPVSLALEVTLFICTLYYRETPGMVSNLYVLAAIS